MPRKRAFVKQDREPFSRLSRCPTWQCQPSRVVQEGSPARHRAGKNRPSGLDRQAAIECKWIRCSKQSTTTRYLGRLIEAFFREFVELFCPGEVWSFSQRPCATPVPPGHSSRAAGRPGVSAEGTAVWQRPGHSAGRPHGDGRLHGPPRRLPARQHTRPMGRAVSDSWAGAPLLGG